MKRTSPLSIWVLTYEYSPYIIGGLGTVATFLTQALAQEKLNMTVICTSLNQNPDLEEQGHLRVIKIPNHKEYYHSMNRSFIPSSCAQAVDEYAPSVPDIIHVHSLQFAELASYYKKRYKCPIVYSCHSLIDRKARKQSRLQQKSMMSEASVILVPSHWQKNILYKEFPEVSKKLRVIQHGVPSVPVKSKGSQHHLLFVGRLIRAKGIEELIASLKLLKHRRKQLQLHIVGTGSETYQKKLRSLARFHGVTSKIHWHGFVAPDQIQSLYSKYGAVVMPSKKESFGLVALEAMAHGVPLVSTRSGGLGEFVNRRNAQIISVISPRAIAKAIFLMWKNTALTNQRIKMARLVARRLNWSNIAKHYKEIFEKLAARSLN